MHSHRYSRFVLAATDMSHLLNILQITLIPDESLLFFQVHSVRYEIIASKPCIVHDTSRLGLSCSLPFGLCTRAHGQNSGLCESAESLSQKGLPSSCANPFPMENSDHRPQSLVPFCCYMTKSVPKRLSLIAAQCQNPNFMEIP